MSENNFLFAIISTCVILFNIFNSEIPVKAADAEYNSPARTRDKASHRYYALRSCHQVLRGESGEFFSPDFLCCNPPLWCNWTIEVPPGRRIRLQLEDYTPAESCHLKRGEIHLDESPGSGRHRTLEQCWRNAVYTSDSSTVYVFLLINGSQEPTYRGFHAQYQAFGVPLATPPPPPPLPPTKTQNSNSGSKMEETLFKVYEEEKPALEQVQMDADPALSSPTDSPTVKEGRISKSPIPEQPIRTAPADQASSDLAPALSRESDLQAAEAKNAGLTEVEGSQPKRQSGDSADNLSVLDGPSKGDPLKETPADTKGEKNLGSLDPPDRGFAKKRPAPTNVTSPTPLITDPLPETLSSTPSSEFEEREPDDDSFDPGPRSSRKLRDDWDEDLDPGRPALIEDHAPHSGSVERQGTEVSRGGSSIKRPGMPPALEDSFRGRADSARLFRNASVLASLPGENLFEVSVEVRLNPNANDNWDTLVRLSMLSVQTMIQEEMKAHVAPKRISSIRIKRLSGGVLYIFWLLFGDSVESLQAHRLLLTALPRLQERTVNTRGRASIALVSSEDVNECGTQLVLCDVNAECINRFGTYACRCRPGYEDKSRLGSGGTVCVAPPGPAHSQPPPSPPSTLLNCLYGLCFLLACFVILLLCIVGSLYRRHHRGAFMVPCHSHENGSSSSSCGGGGGGGGDSGPSRNGSPLPPPPPPVRRPRNGWAEPQDKCPSTELPLLKFAPLAPSDGTVSQEQEEGDKL